jgi:hypothetical protein
MRLSSFVLGVLCIAALALVSIPSIAQDQEDVRGAFLTSRPKEKPANSASATKPSRRRPKTTGNSSPNTGSNKVQTGNTNTANNSSTNNSATGSTVRTPVNSARLGLGMTLFMRDSNGLAVRTDPAHVFQKGDRVRVILETNSDGYLYIFNTTNDGPPVMIYPDPQLDEAGNYLQAHVPFEIPASTSEQESLRWFTFDDVAGDEKLFFVFTREPLKGVPIDDDLLTLCRDSTAACPVKPASDLWAKIQNDLKSPLATDRNGRYGRAETEAEQQATSRGLGLAKDDPQPSLIMMASSNTPTLVTTLALVHK